MQALSLSLKTNGNLLEGSWLLLLLLFYLLICKKDRCRRDKRDLLLLLLLKTDVRRQLPSSNVFLIIHDSFARFGWTVRWLGGWDICTAFFQYFIFDVNPFFLLILVNPLSLWTFFSKHFFANFSCSSVLLFNFKLEDAIFLCFGVHRLVVCKKPTVCSILVWVDWDEKKYTTKRAYKLLLFHSVYFGVCVHCFHFPDSFFFFCFFTLCCSKWKSVSKTSEMRLQVKYQIDTSALSLLFSLVHTGHFAV